MIILWLKHSITFELDDDHDKCLLHHRLFFSIVFFFLSEHFLHTSVSSPIDMHLKRWYTYVLQREVRKYLNEQLYLFLSSFAKVLTKTAMAAPGFALFTLSPSMLSHSSAITHSGSHPWSSPIDQKSRRRSSRFPCTAIYVLPVFAFMTTCCRFPYCLCFCLDL